MNEALADYRDYICKQVLATSLETVADLNEGDELDFEDFKLMIMIND
jgi:isoleucyl-tRNA synthetase